MSQEKPNVQINVFVNSSGVSLQEEAPAVATKFVPIPVTPPGQAQTLAAKPTTAPAASLLASAFTASFTVVTPSTIDTAPKKNCLVYRLTGSMTETAGIPPSAFNLTLQSVDSATLAATYTLDVFILPSLGQGPWAAGTVFRVYLAITLANTDILTGTSEGTLA